MDKHGKNGFIDLLETFLQTSVRSQSPVAKQGLYAGISVDGLRSVLAPTLLFQCDHMVCCCDLLPYRDGQQLIVVHQQAAWPTSRICNFL